MTTTDRYLRIAEFLLICCIVPTVIIYCQLGRYMFLFLWAVFIYSLITLRRTHGSYLQPFWGIDGVRQEALPMIKRFCIAFILLNGLVYYYFPDQWLKAPLNQPLLLLMIMPFYAVLSAFPQEYVFCTFLFNRYSFMLGQGKARIIISSLIFAYAHMLYINPIAPLLSFFGGLIFSTTYHKTQSLALVTLEHTLYGWAIFIVGLGPYFISARLT